MILISHRGNVYGPHELENTLSHIDVAIEHNFEVEVDVWFLNGRVYFGHNEPENIVHENELRFRQDKLWCHAKNLHALKYLLDNGYHCFWHQTDYYTLTSKNYIWVYGEEKLPIDDNCIISLKQRKLNKYMTGFAGICSDYIGEYDDYI